MIRWTTPELVLTVDRDLTGCDVWISMVQGRVQLDMKAENMVCGSVKTITRVMEQKETAQFKAGRPIFVQVNWIDKDGNRKATRQRQIMMSGNLLDKEVQYGD